MITQRERPINIKDLVIKEPKVMDETAPFSIKRDIEEQDYQAMIKFVNNRFMLRWSEELCETACHLYTIFPQRRNDFIKNNELSDRLLDWIRTGDSYQFRYKYFLKTVYPDVHNLFPPNKKLYQNRWNEIMTSINRGQESFHEVEDLAYIKTLDPDLVVSEEENKTLGILVEAFDLELPEYKVTYAMTLKVLAPELFEKLNITGDFWKNSRSELNEFKKKKYWKFFAKLANQLNIISAREIKFQNGEMIIVPPIDLESDNVAPLPETRRF